MSPFLLSAGQASIDAYRKEMLVKEYLAKQAKLAGTTTPAPAIEMSDESSLHIESNESNESSDVSLDQSNNCLLYTSPSPRDRQKSRMPSSA